MDEKRTIKLSYTNKATIPSGIQYSNFTPSYTVTQEIRIDDDNQSADLTTKNQMQWMKQYVDDMVMKDFDLLSNLTRKELPTENMYHVIDGKKWPRVTSIITPDRPEIPHIDDHAELGTKLDQLFKDYIEDGEMKYEKFKDKGNIDLTWKQLFDQTIEFVKENDKDIQFKQHSVSVKNTSIHYAGEADAYGMYKGEFALFDFKKTKSISGQIKKKYFMQLAAYANGIKSHSIAIKPQVLVILSPWNKPIVTDEIDKYFLDFVDCRSAFRRRFGL